MFLRMVGEYGPRWQRLGVSLRQENVIAGRDIINLIKKSFPMIDALMQFILILCC